jgi:TATA-binding protein-associated factor Taf7
LIHHYLVQAELENQSATLGVLKRLVLNSDPNIVDEDEESDEEDDGEEDEESEEEEEDTSEHDNTKLSPEALDFLVAVVKAGRKQIFTLTKSKLVSIIDATYPLPKDQLEHEDSD